MSQPRLIQSLSHIEVPAKQSHRGGCQLGTLVISYLVLRRQSNRGDEQHSLECAKYIYKQSCMKRCMKSSHVGAWAAVTTRCMRFSRHFVVLVEYNDFSFTQSLTIKSHKADSSLHIFPYTYLSDLVVTALAQVSYFAHIWGLQQEKGTIRMFFF